MTMGNYANGPAEAATSPDRGSNIPHKEMKLNETTDIMSLLGSPVPSRRGFMGAAIAAAASVATSPTPTLAEVSGKTSRLAQSQEHPWDQARRLSDELSAVLSHIEGADWFVTIYPLSKTEWPVMFGNITAHEAARSHVEPRLLEVIDAHESARRHRRETSVATDGLTPSKAALRRHRQAARDEDSALNDLLSFPPRNEASSAHKAAYLRKFVRMFDLSEKQFDLLLASMSGRRA